jgi:hypothetical protein
MTYVILTAFLAAGFCVGRLIRLPGWIKKATSWALTACLFGIVFLLGLKLGGNEALFAQAGSIGVKALVLACGSVLGSVLLVKGYATLREMPKQGRRG